MTTKQQMTEAFKKFIEGQISPVEYCTWMKNAEDDLSKLLDKDLINKITIDQCFFEERSNELHYRLNQVMFHIGIILKGEGIAFSDTTREFHQKEANRILEEEKPLSEFLSKLESAVENSVLKCAISCRVTSPFIQRLYKRYMEDGTPPKGKKFNDWFTNAVLPEFISLDGKYPRWYSKFGITKWPIYGDSPEVFLKQFIIPEQDVKNGRFIGGLSVYVFGHKVPVPEAEGFKIEYTVFDHTIDEQGQSIEEHYTDEDKRSRKQTKK